MIASIIPEQYVPFLSDFDRNFLINTIVVFLSIWVVLEIGFFYLINYVLAPTLQTMNDPHHHHMDPTVCILRVFDTLDALDNISFEHYLFKFFKEAKFEDIHIENVRSFFGWAMYGLFDKDLSKEERAQVQLVMEEAQRRYHHVLGKMKPGFNPAVQHTAFNLEPIPFVHRPLLMYIGASLIEIVSNLFLLRMAGFQKLELDGVTYWYRQSSSAPTDSSSGLALDPILVLHGISTGWSFYAKLVLSLAKDRTVILYDFNSIKVKSLAFSMPTPVQFTQYVMRILKRHRITKVSVVGHSFGTITAGWLVKLHPEVVTHLTLIDPVSLLLLTGDVCYNFLYRRPSSMIEWVIYLAASREITISNMLHRHFWWYVNAIFLEDIPKHIGVVVGVAGNDEISNPKAVHEYVLMCQKQRQHLAEAATVLYNHTRQLNRSASTNTLTRSTSQIRLQQAAAKAEQEAAQQQQHQQPWIAPIQGVYWEKFSHGQILMGGSQYENFLGLIHCSEKVCAAHSC